jgi:hypothetical protein
MSRYRWETLSLIANGDGLNVGGLDSSFHLIIILKILKRKKKKKKKNNYKKPFFPGSSLRPVINDVNDEFSPPTFINI